MSEPLGWFGSFDKDGNGRLDKNELMHIADWELLLKAYDLNGDGEISHDEAEQSELPPHRWRALRASLKVLNNFQQLDRNHDGKLSTFELGRRAYLVEKLDTMVITNWDQQS